MHGDEDNVFDKPPISDLDHAPKLPCTAADLRGEPGDELRDK
jgi:hypothetical protein